MNIQQIEQIRLGLEDGLSAEQIQQYAKAEFDDSQMVEIREGLEKGLSIEQVQQYVELEFTHLQMDGIYFGLKQIQMKIVSGHSLENGQKLC